MFSQNFKIITSQSLMFKNLLLFSIYSRNLHLFRDNDNVTTGIDSVNVKESRVIY